MSEWDIFVNPSGKWSYRWEFRFDSVKIQLGSDYRIVGTSEAEWQSMDKKDHLYFPA